MQTATRHGRGSRDGTPDPGALVGADWLQAHLGDPDVRVVEVDVASARYEEWHIDGAVLWDVYADLKDPDHRPVDPSRLEQLMGRSGITPDSTVVFYGYAPALGLWLMQLFGHPSARLLNCSRDTWLAEGRPWTTATNVPATTDYIFRADGEKLRATQADVRDAIGRGDTVLADVRTRAEYAGEHFWPSGGMQPDGRAGHVPSAMLLEPGNLYDERGAFRDLQSLRAQFAPVLHDDREVITYCTIGGRASTAWFVLTHLLGRERVRVYDGSWAEWGRAPGAPVATAAWEAADRAAAQPHTRKPEREGGVMPSLSRKSLDSPEEVRPFENDSGHLDLVNLDAGPVGRAVFKPGWRWSKDVRPIAKTDSCQAAHACYFVSGRMVVVSDDGEQVEYGPGDFALMAPGHDAWIVGDEPCVVVDWQGFADYAKP